MQETPLILKPGTLKDGRAVHVERLDSSHERGAFDCGVKEINRFFRKYALDNAAKGSSQTYVAFVEEETSVAGFVTFCAGSIAFQNPPANPENLPRYPVPVIHLAQLGVRTDLQGQGLGTILMTFSFRLTLQVARLVGCYALDLIASNDSARMFYIEKFGFQPLTDQPNRLILPRRHIEIAVQAIDAE